MSLLVNLSAADVRFWLFIISLRLIRCSDVWRKSVRGEGGSGLGVRARAATGAGAAFGFAAGCAGDGGASSTGCGMASIFTFRRGARSLLPAGRPLDLGSGVGVGGGTFSAELLGIVSEFWGGFFEFSLFVDSFSGIVAALSGILASTSAIFKERETFFSRSSR